MSAIIKTIPVIRRQIANRFIIKSNDLIAGTKEKTMPSKSIKAAKQTNKKLVILIKRSPPSVQIFRLMVFLY